MERSVKPKGRAKKIAKRVKPIAPLDLSSGLAELTSSTHIRAGLRHLLARLNNGKIANDELTASLEFAKQVRSGTALGKTTTTRERLAAHKLVRGIVADLDRVAVHVENAQRADTYGPAVTINTQTNKDSDEASLGGVTVNILPRLP